MTLPVPIGAGARAGQWHAILTVDKVYYKRYLSMLADKNPELYQQVKAHGVRYSLSVQSYSGLRLQARLLQDSQEPGAMLTVRGVLTEYGLPIGAGRVTVRAEYERPDGTGGVLTLTEEQADTGIYVGNLVAPLAGVYPFRILANGTTMRGRVFTREHLLTGAVWQGGDNPPPTSKDDPNVDHERLCQLLSCLLSERVITPEFEGRLKEFGLNLDTLRTCLKAWCRQPQPPVVRPAIATVGPGTAVMTQPMPTPEVVELIRRLARELNG
jgi:hypothetical protein